MRSVSLFQLTCHELSSALGSLLAADLPTDGDYVVLTGSQSGLGEGGEAAVHLGSYLLLILLLFGGTENNR